MRSAGVASSTCVARPLSCTDSKVEKCVAVSAIAPAVPDVGAGDRGLGREQHPDGAVVEHLHPPGPAGIGQAVGVDRAHDERARRLEQLGELRSDHTTPLCGRIPRSSEFLAFAHAPLGAGPPRRSRKMVARHHDPGASEAAPGTLGATDDRHRPDHAAVRRDRRPRRGDGRHLPRHPQGHPQRALRRDARRRPGRPARPTPRSRPSPAAGRTWSVCSSPTPSTRTTSCSR